MGKEKDGWREVVMAREDLDGLPHFDLPDGFSIRAFQSGDESHWRAIHERADAFNVFTPESFTQQFGSDERELEWRQKYLLAPTGEVVGTATAWFDSAEVGRVHWVALLPECQSRGLGKPLVCAVLQTLRELGHSRAVLSTDSRRPAAIALYERLGFRVVEGSVED
jgi:ribosomal protein S18 acetylase RimI-like enzyme